MRFHLIGNCQVSSAGEFFKILTGNDFVYRHGKGVLLSEYSGNVGENDVCVFSDMPHIKDQFHEDDGVCGLKSLAFPSVRFSGQMQDCVYSKGNKVKSPIGAYHSFIAICSFLFGYDEDQCLSFFNERFYESLGYFCFMRAEVERLKNYLLGYGVEEEVVDGWLACDRFMYTVNHPKAFVIEDIVKSVLKKNGFPFKEVDVASYCYDKLADGPVFPIYISQASGRPLPLSSYVFRASRPVGEVGKVYSLDEFVYKSYEIYRECKEDLGNTRLDGELYEKYEKIFQSEFDCQKQLSFQVHPYQNKPDYCFWKRSITGAVLADVDPVTSTDFRITPTQKIATAGSCFAQHIAKRLSRLGFNYFVVENAPNDMSPEEQKANGYGVFSGRYGNIYTTRQLLQLFERAYGSYQPSINTWQRKDGRYVDPFRPQIQADGFNSKEEVVSERTSHLASVRKMFEELDIFVFTLGLTECWEHIEDGAILPVAPGVVGGPMDWDKYRFVNFSKEEVKSDLNSFIKKLRLVNPSAKILLTVSPVPLMATYENRHVLVSTTVSKAILRVVADEITAEYGGVYYFPSYEIITGNFSRGKYYQDDLREVRQEGVDHVMRLFVKHMTQAESSHTPLVSSQELTVPNVDSYSSVNSDFNQALDGEGGELDEIFCEEELLDEKARKK